MSARVDAPIGASESVEDGGAQSHSGPRYIGRFAPSPTGPLHAGSLVAALASWLDARAHGGRWLVRIEDADTERCQAGLGEHILAQLAAFGLLPDATPVWQTQRTHLYDQALQQLANSQDAFPCACTRRQIDEALAAQGAEHVRHGERVYPGTCRHGLPTGATARAWRFASWRHAGVIRWVDRRLGPQAQDVSQAVGDFVLRRADGPWAYQLAVVVDDADQGITHVVRGADLTDNTPRQILLQQVLGLPRPHYLHTPLVLAADGQKLSKQNGAAALNTQTPQAVMQTLRSAILALGLPLPTAQALTPAELLGPSVTAWAGLYNPCP